MLGAATCPTFALPGLSLFSVLSTLAAYLSCVHHYLSHLWLFCSYFLHLVLVTWFQSIGLANKCHSDFSIRCNGKTQTNILVKYLPWHREPETPCGMLTQAVLPLLNLHVYKSTSWPSSIPGPQDLSISMSSILRRQRERWVLDRLPSDKLQPFEGRTHFVPTIYRFCRAGILLKCLFWGVHSPPCKAI